MSNYVWGTSLSHADYLQAKCPVVSLQLIPALLLSERAVKKLWYECASIRLSAYSAPFADELHAKTFL